jgi:NAD kinase
MSALTQNAPAQPVTILERPRFENVVIVTRKTQLEELIARFNTVAQARFYLEHAGQDFMPIAQSHEHYHAVLDMIRSKIDRGLKRQLVDRTLLPQMVVSETDLVITVGPDGLVANTAKFVNGQPIMAINPDPRLYDGVLLSFTEETFPKGLADTLGDSVRIKGVTMAEACLDDGQTLLGFNDLFVGARSHVSARYRIEQNGVAEDQSSSGIIVSTGAGSTGWLQSVYAGAAGIVEALGGQVVPPPRHGRMPWDAEYLVYAVREPFPSNVTQTGLIYGVISKETPLVLTSRMSDFGVVFSDGVEADRLDFNAGARVTISLANQTAKLVVSAGLRDPLKKNTG